MKTSLLVLLGALVVSSFGCASSRNLQPYGQSPVTPESVDSSPTANLLIVSAVYGSGVSFADVTYRVNTLVHIPGSQFSANPGWLKADPTPGWNKALVIVYEYKGRRHSFSCGEGAPVSADLLIKNAK